ncbi:MAG: M56 family metallopeptidase [Solobacterium sp.]|nr:M56 family metallopeptidase [Solobacterium sp.]
MFYETSSFILLISLYIGLYYTLLVPSIRFLRKHFSAYTCAIFWLLPNYLYFTLLPAFTPKSFYIIKINKLTLYIFFILWFCGFIVSFAYSVFMHFSTRKRLLKNIYDPPAEVQDLWKECMRNIKSDYAEYHLAVCPELETPLAIGVFKNATYVLLPPKEYTDEELGMIFRHELTHILAEDPGTKMDMAFFTALNWFNPFMYKAIRKTSEDLELSCDEIVIKNYTDEQKKKYAQLILSNSSETKGFTTCLSASADSLRYRLKEIVHPQKKHLGIILVINVFLIMVAGFSLCAFAVKNGTLQDHIKNYTHIENMEISGIENIPHPYHQEKELLSSIGDIQMFSLYSTQDFEDPSIYVVLSNPDRDRIMVEMKNHRVHISRIYDGSYERYTYYIDETIEEISAKLLPYLQNE